MKNIIYKILIFLRNVHTSGTPESAKRFYGGIGFLFCLAIFAFYFFANYKHNYKIDNDILDYSYDIFYVSASLIGLETLTGLIGRNKNKITDSVIKQEENK